MVRTQNDDECGGKSEGNECLYIERVVLIPSVIVMYHVFFYVTFLLCTFCPRLH